MTLRLARQSISFEVAHAGGLSGTVTFLFSDIEGSTALRTTLGDSATDALFRRHDALVREQIESNKGQDQKAALGDGFLAVFLSTRRAVACGPRVPARWERTRA